MQHSSQEIIITVVILLIAFLLLVFFILLILARHRMLGKKSKMEKEHMKLEFNQQLSLSQLEIQEETLNAVGQEIHDNVGQILSLVKMQLNVMLVSKNTSERELEDIRDNTGRAMSELRNIAKSLNNDWLQNLDLEEAIRREIDYMNKGSVTHFVLEVSGTFSLPNKTKIILFRIVQEACHNILKHTNASKANIKLLYGTEYVSLEIVDNGEGFDVEHQPVTGIGLSNMRKRSGLIGATFVINSIPGIGSTIHLRLNYKP